VGYSVGLVGLISVKVLAPGFYARQDIRTPVKIALCTLVATQVMNLLFIGPLQHAGLALSIGLASLGNAFFLSRGLRSRGVYRPGAGWLVFVLKLCLGLLVLSAVLLWFMGSADWWLTATATARLARLAGVVVAGAVAYFVVLWLCGFRISDFRRRSEI
ncbi:MAG: hypothetical protein RIR70_176, partial [Pseudomonadota bacterium]